MGEQSHWPTCRRRAGLRSRNGERLHGPFGRLGVLAFAAALACARTGLAPSRPAVDWARIPTTTIRLFHPGQSSYAWLQSEAHTEETGQALVDEACVSCHEGEEAEIGRRLVAGGDLEPAPLEGRDGIIDLRVQVAYDDATAYFRFRWRTRNPYPGEAHPFHRFDGERWTRFGGSRLDGAVRSGAQPAIYEDRLSMQIDDGAVPGFEVYGCWLTCHDGERDMREEATGEAVSTHPVLGASGLGKTDVRKYVPSTRRSPGWAGTKSAVEIARIGAGGGFVDLIQWRAHRSNPVGMADDGYVLEYRRTDAGQGPFEPNWDAEARRPRFMYDPRAQGHPATRIGRIRQRPTALVREENAAAFDPSFPWRPGDLIPAYVTSRSAARGSAADNREASGVWRDGEWTLVWARPLGLSHPDDKPLRPGAVYTFGFAVHDDNVGSRGHHVSWPLSLGFGVPADLTATRLP